MLPKQIVIGATTWKVVVAKLEEDWGQCVSHTNEIMISEDISEQQQESTLIHEMLHACCGHAGIGYDKKMKEEKFVERLEHILYSALRQNGFWPKESA